MHSDSSAVVGSALLLCIDVLPPPLVFESPRTKPLVLLNIIISATPFNEPSGLCGSVAFHFSSDPGPRGNLAV